jgi:hypothetical protein
MYRPLFLWRVIEPSPFPRLLVTFTPSYQFLRFDVQAFARLRFVLGCQKS